MDADEKSREIYKNIVQDAARPGAATEAAAPVAPRSNGLRGVLLFLLLATSGGLFIWYRWAHQSHGIDVAPYSAVIPIDSGRVMPADRDLELTLSDDEWTKAGDESAQRAILDRLAEVAQKNGYSSVRVRDRAGLVVAMARPGEVYIRPVGL